MITSVRTTTHRGLAAGLALVALNSLGLCNTWIVDKLNGPGTNFVDIPPAIAAAAPGDVIIVRTGIYAPFTLSHGLSILGQGSVRTSGAIAVNAVPAGEIAVIRNVVPNLLVSWGIAIQVSSCSGVVLLQRLDCHIGVNASTDVRIQDVTSGPVLVDSATGLEIVDSRVQIVKSSFSGGWGKDADCVNMGGDGGTGVYCLGASRVHFSLSTARGGDKGADDPVCGQPSGYIGSGLVVGDYPPLNRLELILTGSGIGHLAGGAAQHGGPDSWFSMEVHNAQVWSSGMLYTGMAPIVYTGGTLVTLLATEPTLEMIGTPAPGGMITLRLRAEPGTVARLNLGKTPIVQATPGILVEALVQKERSFDRGVVPASGVIDSVWSFAPSAPQGKLLIFQVRLVDPITGLAQRSNSIEAIVQ